MRGDAGKSVALGGAVILEEHRTKPFDHPLLHLDRTRRGAMDGRSQSGYVVAVSHRLGELQHSHEHGRDPQAVGAPVLFDMHESRLGIETLRHHAARSYPVHGHADSKRRSMIKRCRRVHHAVLGGVTEQMIRLAFVARIFAQPVTGNWNSHSFGTTGGARRVKRVLAFDLICDSGGWLRAAGFLPRGVTTHDAAHHETFQQARDPVVERLGNLCFLFGGDKNPCVAIFNDIRHFGRSEVTGYTGVIESSPVCGPADLEVTGIVLHVNRNAVSNLETHRPEQLRALDGTRLELPESDHLTRIGQDTGWSIRIFLGVHARVHDGARKG